MIWGMFCSGSGTKESGTVPLMITSGTRDFGLRLNGPPATNAGKFTVSTPFDTL